MGGCGSSGYGRLWEQGRWEDVIAGELEGVEAGEMGVWEQGRWEGMGAGEMGGCGRHRGISRILRGRE